MHRGNVHLLALVALLCMCMESIFSTNTTNSTEPEHNRNIITTPEAVSNSSLHTTVTAKNDQTVNSPGLSDKEITTIFSTVYDYSDKSTDVNDSAAIPTSNNDQTSLVTSPSSTKTAAATSVSTAEAASDYGKGVGVFFLIFILILIFILVGILYIFWKKGRRYSFDLTNNDHDTPLRSMDYGGVFSEHTKEPMSPDDVQDEKPNETKPVSNGCSTDSPELTLPSEQKNLPEENSFSSDNSLPSPVKRVEFNLDLDLICDLEPETQAPAEPSEPGQNENNNNDTSTGNDSVDLFTEINLDEPQ